MEGLLTLLNKPLTQVAKTDKADALAIVDLNDDQEELSYQNVFAKLAVIDDDKQHVVRMARQLTNAKADVLQRFLAKNQASGGKVRSYIFYRYCFVLFVT